MALNVLLVDDSSTMRAMIAKTLHMSIIDIGEIIEAANGSEGLEKLDQHWIDLVMVDINMPVMTGVEMIQRMRENPEHAQLPIIVVSTESSETRIEQVRLAGVEFIHKPFTPEQVADVIRRTVEDIPDAN